MSMPGEASDAVLKVILDGTEVTLKLLGSGAKELALMLLAAVKNEKENAPGAVTFMKDVSKDGSVTSVVLNGDDFAKFADQAKSYGIRFCGMKGNQSDLVRVAFRSGDAPRVKMLCEDAGIGTMERESILSDEALASAEQSVAQGTGPAPDAPMQAGPETPVFSFGGELEPRSPENPTPAQTVAGSPSEPSLNNKPNSAVPHSEGKPKSDKAVEKVAEKMRSTERPDGRKSVRKQLSDIRAAQASKGVAKVAPEATKLTAEAGAEVGKTAAKAAAEAAKEVAKATAKVAKTVVEVL